MLIGQVIGHEAIVRLTLSNGQMSKDIEAGVDTGFSDTLTVSPELVVDLGLRKSGEVFAELGDGAVEKFDTVEVMLDWNGLPRQIEAWVATGGSLIGMELLYDCHLHIDVTEGGMVTITPFVQS